MSDQIVTKGTTYSVEDLTHTPTSDKLVVVVDVTEEDGGSLVVTISGVTPSGYEYPLLVSATLDAVATTPLRIFPGATPSANAVANDVVPQTIKIDAAVTGDITYGIDVISGGE